MGARIPGVMLLYTLTIFFSAFLLFEVQPIIAKIILPWFGGTSAVWSTCMLFFQMVLLLGYLYAHWINRKLSPRQQAILHITLLAVSLATLPILPNPSWKNAGVGQPSMRILALLTVTVGLPYFLLSSTSPLVQSWYARTHKSSLPYRLFALSNFASLLALLSYPLLIEPNLATRNQGLIWSGAYILFAVSCGLTVRSASIAPSVLPEPGPQGDATDYPEPGWTLRLLWFGLSGAASVLLLAVTNHLTQDVSAIPFLWILPLTVYLITFIVCFEAPRLYTRWLFIPLLVAALGFMAYRVFPGHTSGLTARNAIALFGASLFVSCMVCHGELVRLKPHPRWLTSFYVLVSLGGAAGGLFVGLVAPNLFRAYYEFPIGLGFCAVVAAIVFARALWLHDDWRRIWGSAVLGIAVCGYGIYLFQAMSKMVTGYLVVERNFYGLLRVYDSGDPHAEEYASRKLVHGVINHGEQMLNEPYRHQPVTYFCPGSGIGRAMQLNPGVPRKIGILGLGCGTLAAYGRQGDTLRIYEINPLVLEIARREFSYVNDTPAKVEFALGDGRLVLESEPSQQFDVLVMDAFSGDSVPVHLITKEALATYFRHLKPDGILAINITNTYLDLEPVMERAAAAYNRIAMVYHFSPEEEQENLCFTSGWALILNRATAESHPELWHDVKILSPRPGFRMWTDDFSNMWSILR